MDQRGSRGHQWQSQDYAAFWVADAEARDDDRIEQLRLLANLIPHPHDAPIRVLDLGAGYGIVTSMVLARFPNARVTLFDLSEAMLAHARPAPRRACRPARLGARRPDHAGLGGGRAWAVRRRGVGGRPAQPRRRPAHRRDLWRAGRLLRPGGAFLCYDHVSAGGPRIEQQFDALRPTRRHGDEAVRAAAREPAAYPHDHGPASTAVATPAAPGALRFPGGIAAHLDWVRAAGFAEADCFWKLQHQCLYGGYMPE